VERGRLRGQEQDPAQPALGASQRRALQGADGQDPRRFLPHRRAQGRHVGL